MSDANFAEGVYWGDTHLHTSYFTDAGMMGNRLGPEEAYRFARGEEVIASHGMRARLIWPLVFLVVSDHAENLGLAAVWARENTRPGIFEAMERRETFATTGTRILVRFFGGWDYQEDDVFRPDAVSIGYRKGVTMGGDLTVSGGRTIDSDGRCRTPVGDTVDVADASHLNTIGDAELRAVWTDPNFNPEHRGFYYARVLETPTPTWQAYDAKFFAVEMPETIAMKGQGVLTLRRSGTRRRASGLASQGVVSADFYLRCCVHPEFTMGA